MRYIHKTDLIIKITQVRVIREILLQRKQCLRKQQQKEMGKIHRQFFREG